MALRDRGLAQLRRLGAPLLFAALAVLHTWPLASDPAGLSRLDNADTTLNTWIVAWVAHALRTAPLALFDAPIFHPSPDALAFSEHLFVPALMGAPLSWAGVPPVLVYNLLVLAGFALSAWAMSHVVARWTGSGAAGLVAGAAYAFNAHLLTRLPHLQALHVEFFPLALLALDAVLDGEAGEPRPPWRAGAALGGLFALQALCSNYTLVFLSFALVAAVAVRPDAWLRRPRAAWPALALAGLVGLALVAPFLWPYYRVNQDQGMTRSIEEVARYSAGWRDYLVTGGRLHYDLWSHAFFEGRTALFPGVVVTGLAGVALATGAWWRDRRARMLVALGLGGVLMSFGPALPGYTWLHAHVPLLQGIRGAARWGWLGLVAVAGLAGFGVARLERRWGATPWWPAIAVGLLGLVTLEAMRAPMGFVPPPEVSPVYRAVAADPRAIVAEFPLFPAAAIERNARYLLPAASHFRPLVNGYSGFVPERYARDAEVLRAFPSDAAVTRLRALGVTRVVLHVDAFLAERGEDALRAVGWRADLELLEEDGDVRLYRLK
ncbi:MAG: hypothetical protein AB7H88_20445 [Vicinamibacterales bacterium]